MTYSRSNASGGERGVGIPSEVFFGVGGAFIALISGYIFIDSDMKFRTAGYLSLIGILIAVTSQVVKSENSVAA